MDCYTSMSLGSIHSRNDITLNSWGWIAFMPPSAVFSQVAFHAVWLQRATPPIDDRPIRLGRETACASSPAALQRSQLRSVKLEMEGE